MENNYKNNEIIEIIGAREHNLKNVNLKIPRNKLTVFTGLSGSGKSSLAFDTIFAEGQRRYLETFSAYARNFLGTLERPNVDKISGLSPVISIEQKTTNKNPRSTVGTITEIYDFLRLLYAKASYAYSYETGEKMVKYSEEKIIDLITEVYNNEKIIILSPVVKNRKGHYKELFEQILRKGYIMAQVDDALIEITHGYKLDRYKNHTIDIVIDKLKVNNKSINRLRNTVKNAFKQGKGLIAIKNIETGEQKYYSKSLMCPTTGISYNTPAPHTFSFNSPMGACTRCNGIGVVSDVDIKTIIPDDSISIARGGIAPLGKYKNSLIFLQLEAIAKKYDFKLSTPIKDIPKNIIDAILYGTSESLSIKNPFNGNSNYFLSFEGIVNYLIRNNNQNKSRKSQIWSEQFVKKIVCPECNGARLKKESLHFKIVDKNISELADLDLKQLSIFFENIDNLIDDRQKIIASEILKEIKTRLKFLLDVGLNYLSLNRRSNTLSGGESQRIRLATQIGSKLVNVLYILDEPSIGLHQRDNKKLINSLKALRDIENTIIVVEHDKEMILSADNVVDIGPFAGKHGGEIITNCSPKELLTKDSLTSKYLSGKIKIEIPKNRRKGNGKFIELEGAVGHNLKNVNVKFPLNTMICVTGVSGSGKSSLINYTLHPIISQKLHNSLKPNLPYKSIKGLENIDKIIEVSQSPIGRTPRSNPVTFTGVFTDIRNLFEQTNDAKIKGYKAGLFSFNVKGGRCETCKGAGMQTIEMNFLPDVYVKCPECNGKRYNDEILQVKYKDCNINDVLEMTVNQAVEFFENIPKIKTKLKALKNVGLGYLTLGQPSTTLSGGEAQRVKLAAELAKRDTGNTLYILDEPTTGLHFEDIRILLKVLNKLVDKGNTIIIIEHNLDIIKVSDYIIDIGLEGGNKGGKIIAVGTPEKIIKNKKSHTAKYLKSELP